MVIRLTKRRDGNTVLRCDRADGTSTWQRQDGKLASVFPFHDMTHYAVETEMGFRCGNGPEVRRLEEDEIVRVRARVRDLVQRWNDLAPDGTLELPFDPGTE